MNTLTPGAGELAAASDEALMKAYARDGNAFEQPPNPLALRECGLPPPHGVVPFS
jgi:hypothetical protein